MRITMFPVRLALQIILKRFLFIPEKWICLENFLKNFRFSFAAIYNVILQCAINSEERHRVTGSSLWMALTNQINFLYKKQRTKPRNQDTIRTDDKKQLSQGRSLVKEIRAFQLVAVKREKIKH